MDNFKAFSAFLGAVMGYVFGDWDGFILALIIFIIIDYVTGVISAICNKKLSSAVGFHGILKKIFILLLVAVGNILDGVLGLGGVIRSAVIFFYIANEGISIIENAANIGLPVPQKIRDILEQLKDNSDEDNDNDGEENEDDGNK